MAHDVFISYSTKDKTVADALCAALESQGIQCWIAPRDIRAGDYGEAIVEGINESRLMVLVFSSHANTSPHIKREVERAVSKGLTIVPLRIEDVEPTRALEYYISAVHWLDALTPPIDKHLNALGDRIRPLLARATAGPPAPAVAPAAPAPESPAPPPPVPVASPAVAAPVAPAPVTAPTPAAAPAATSPPARRFGLAPVVGGAVAAAVLAAVLWAQPWSAGDKAREETTRQAKLDEQRRQEAARQAQIAEDEKRREDMKQAEATRRSADEAARRADEAAKRLEAARQANEAARRARPAPAPAASPAPPAAVARVDPGAAKTMVEQRLRSRGLLKQSGTDRFGVTVDISGDGVVTLTGVLQSVDQRNETMRLAGDVPGVASVVQHINVQQSWNTR